MVSLSLDEKWTNFEISRAGFAVVSEDVENLQASENFTKSGKSQDFSKS